jgi:hypothetical protein
MCRHCNMMLLSRRRPHPRGKGGWPALSDCEVDPAPANSQSRLLIAQLMAPLGLHAGDEYDAKEFGRGSSQRRPNRGRLQKLLPNLFSSSSQTFPWVGLGSGLTLRSGVALKRRRLTWIRLRSNAVDMEYLSISAKCLVFM